MWARDLEVALGLWLCLSPFVFRHPPDAPGAWAQDLVLGALVVLVALLSYWRRARRAHLLQLLAAAWLALSGWIVGLGGPTASSQNHLLSGLVLGMLAIVPNRASRPPRAWRR